MKISRDDLVLPTRTISCLTNEQESERIQRTTKKKIFSEDFERNKMEILFVSTFKISTEQILWIK